MPWWKSQRHGRFPARVTVAEGVVASAQKFDIENESDRVKLTKLQKQWQTDAAIYVDTTGELKDSQRFIENSFRRMKLYAGWVREADEELIPVGDAVYRVVPNDEKPQGDNDDTVDDYIDQKWADIAEAIVSGFSARDGGQSALMARLGPNIFLIGEAIVIQRSVMERRPLVGEPPAEVPRVWDWEVRSPDEIRPSRQDPKIVVTVDDPSAQDGDPITGIDGVPAYVERIYRKHWKWSGWADSNVRAAIDTLEELRLLGLVARASLRSRAMAGVWTVPDELDFDAADQPGDQGGPRKTVAFDRSFSDAISSSITNEADSASVAPTIVRGKSDYLKRDVFGPIMMPNRYGADERAQRMDAVERLGRTLELPQEQMEGVSGLNHWTAWQIPEQAYRMYLEPLAQVITEGLTYGLLRSQLEAEGCPPEIAARIMVGVDASALIQRVDKGKTATEGLQSDSLSWEAWRRANGFGDDDAPTLQEQALRVALKTKESPALGAILLEQAGIIPPGTADKIIAAGTTAGSPGPGPLLGDPTVSTPSSGPPAAGPPAAVASSRPRGVGARLAAIDTSLRNRILVLCDQAVTQALGRAGARLRNRTKDAALRSAIAAAGGVPNHQLGQRLGPALVASALGASPITADDFADLHDRFERWTSAAQTAARTELSALAGQSVTVAQLASLQTHQDADRKAAWDALLAGLVSYSAYRLTAAEDDEEQTGEWEPTAVVRPGLIRSILAIAGGVSVAATAMGGVERALGGAVGGPATGDTMSDAFAEAGYPATGYVWVYGSEPRATPFEEHLALDGYEFADWDDPGLGGYEPGDHANCFPAGVTVAGPLPIGATLRWYEGALVEVGFASGEFLPATPNHPVLTRRGWVPAGLLVEGDEVVRCGGAEGIAALVPHDRQMPSHVEDVVAAVGIAEGMDSRSMPIAAEDFHGDGEGSEVAVVWTDRLLRDGAQTSLPKPTGEESLTVANPDSPFLASQRGQGYLVERPDPSTSDGVSDGCVGETLGVGHLPGPVSLPGAPVSPFDASGEQTLLDGVPVDTETLCDGLLGLSAEVRLDKVLRVDLAAFAGHVYNLQTSVGWFLADGVIVHNCQCDFEQIIMEDGAADSPGSLGPAAAENAGITVESTPAASDAA